MQNRIAVLISLTLLPLNVL